MSQYSSIMLPWRQVKDMVKKRVTFFTIFTTPPKILTEEIQLQHRRVHEEIQLSSARPIRGKGQPNGLRNSTSLRHRRYKSQPVTPWSAAPHHCTAKKKLSTSKRYKSNSTHTFNQVPAIFRCITGHHLQKLAQEFYSQRFTQVRKITGKKSTGKIQSTKGRRHQNNRIFAKWKQSKSSEK